MKASKSNNYGKGFYFEHADGTRGWVLGMSAHEKKVAIAKHGALKVWKAAV